MSPQSRSVPGWDAKLLAGRVAVVTGATSGIGHACALALARAGADVVINSRPGHEDKGEAVKAEIEALGRKAINLAADVAREDDVEAMVRAACRQFGTIDLMLANAGIQRDAAFVDMSLAAWQEVIGVNLTGQFLCARAAAREFLRRGVDPARSTSAGGIICMSSVHDVIPWAGHVNYAASKGGVALLMRSLAQELAPHRIRVNAISPGAIRTPINRPTWETPDAERRLLQLIPYGRVGEGVDVANAAVWLASDLSDYVTGATLYVDGGMTLYPGFADNG